MSVLLPAIAKRHGEDTKARRLEFRHKKLEGSTEDRQEAASPPQEVREQGKMG